MRTADPWHPQWSSELEFAWATKVANEPDPKASLRPSDSEGMRTRELDAVERDEMRTTAPVEASRRRLRVSHEAHGVAIPSDDFAIIEEVGAGGMGKVFRALQRSLQREVALKRLTPNESLLNAVAHFQSEACITAVLDHPGIVPVHDMGIDQEGNVFYAMKLVEGRPWNELLNEERKNLGEALDLRAHIETLIEVTHAVAFAHSKGIIHRDIKPANVMVGAYGEVLLVDWGLAVSIVPRTELSRIHDLSQVMITCGTPCYMPPEIATGQREWVGTWTDVYMLGATLFEVLYGMPPHQERTAIDVVKVAARNEWTFPEAVPSALAPYHEVFKPVLMRALASHPHHRHRDASEFARALKQGLRYLDSARLASEALGIFKQVEAGEATAQWSEQPRSESNAPHRRYRMLAQVIALFEKALESWPENPTARHYLIEAHLLHAHSSFMARDLVLADTHLHEVYRLPAGLTPSHEQQARAQALYRKLAHAKRARLHRTKVMRTLQATAIASALVLIIGALTAALLVDDARDQATVERNHLSKLLIAAAGDRTNAELRNLFLPVQGSLRLAASWARAGRLDTEDPLELARMLAPVLENNPVVSAIMHADDSGREIMLMRASEGWRVRVVAPRGPARLTRLSRDLTVVESWNEGAEYTPLERPWYRGAERLRGDGAPQALYWTDPYIFYTAGEPGISASIPVETPSGRKLVLAVDVSLTDLSAFTMKLPDEGHGQVFVFTDDERVVGLPRSERFEAAQERRDAVFAPVSELGEPIPDMAVERWNGLGRHDQALFRFELEGQAWWAGFRRFELTRERRFWIGVAVPEEDFDVPEA